LLFRYSDYEIHTNNVRKSKMIGIFTVMNSPVRPFFKGLPKFVAATDELEAHEAEQSVYYWWWSFLRLSPVLWFAQQTGIKPTDPQVAKVCESFGDLRRLSFDRWWRSTGRVIFAESKRPAKVQALALDQMGEHAFDPNKLYVEVPLTIRQQTIVKQFKAILGNAHDGRGLNLAAHSNAEFKLHTKRYRLRTIEAEYWVMLYRLLHPNIEVWRIGDRLQVAPQHRVRDGDGSILNASKHALNSLTGRYLYKGRYSLLHAERGNFPNTDEIELSARHQPFGLKHQTEYRAATKDSKDGTQSAWTQLLKKEYAVTLKYEIVRRNFIESQMRLPDGKMRRRIDAFIAGESDLLA